MLGNTTPDPHQDSPSSLGDLATTARVAVGLLTRNVLTAAVAGQGKAGR
jgi:hypothetical protein